MEVGPYIYPSLDFAAAIVAAFVVLRGYCLLKIAMQ